MSILNMKSSSPCLISPPRVHAKKYILRLEETTKLLSKRLMVHTFVPVLFMLALL